MPIEIDAPVRAKGMVHKQIADVAKGIAGEHYDVLARNNSFYKRWPKQKAYIAHHWRLYVGGARELMTLMLGNPNYTEEFKHKILDALLKDGTINPKKMAEPAKPTYFPTTKQG